MHVPSYQDHRDARDDQAMTPMVDVVFLLLIFFVCASIGQSRESVLPTPLATGSIQSPEIIQQPKPLGEVWVRLNATADKRTRVELQGRAYDDMSSLEETLRSLAKLTTEIPVILDIEPDVPLEDFIRVYDTCRAAEFESIHFAVEAKIPRPGTQPSSGQ